MIYLNKIPFRFIEPTVTEKRYYLIDSRLKKVEAIDVENIKTRLKDIRKNSIDNIETLIENTKTGLEKHKGIKVSYAENAKEAVNKILKLSEGSNTYAINNSSTLMEFLPQLTTQKDIQILDSYIHDLNLEEEDLLKSAKGHYWELPEFDPSVIWHSFEDNTSRTMPFEGTKLADKEFIGLLGVNAVSSEGDIFFLQHLHNITKILSQASKVFIIAGIDKLVGSSEDALFQTRCCALFGYEGILSELFSIREGEMKVKEEDKIVYSDIFPPETHVILLDNGRKKVINSEFKELLHCIGCRVCAKLCPRANSNAAGYRGAKDILLSAFTQGIEHAAKNGLYNCTLCKGCESVCPLDIPLVSFLSSLREEANSKGLSPETYGKLTSNVKEYGTPYGAKALKE